MEARDRLPRLSTGDLMTLWAELPTAPMHIALAGVLEPPEGVGVDDLRRELAARATRAPDLSRCLRWTVPGEGRPLLVDAAGYRPDDHVVILDPATLDDEVAWHRSVAARAVAPMDHRRPLWRADLVPDTGSGRVGVVLVVHHALADGIRGLDLMAALFDDRPTPPATPVVRHPAPVPTRRRLVADNLAGGAATARYAAGFLARRGQHPGRGWSDARAALRELRVRATPTGLDGPLGPTRDLRVVRWPVEALRAIGHTRGATINDVLLAAIAGGMRELLSAHGEPVDGRSLRVSIPVASPPGVRNAGGTTPIVTWLPVGEGDPVARLAAVSRDLTARKAQRDRSYAGVGNSPLVPRFVLFGVTRLMRNHGARMVNLYVTNVPGPAEPLWLGPSRLVGPVPVAPLVAGTRISATALSYGGDLAIALHTDGDLGHAGHLAEGVASTLAELRDRAGPSGTTPR